MSEEYEGTDPEEPITESEALNSRGRFRPRITHRIRRTDADGDARGADRLAGIVAKSYGCKVEEHPADWKGRGKVAGLERNRIMLNTKPNLVVAFPGGTGTANMVSIAREAGVTVRIVNA